LLDERDRELEDRASRFREMTRRDLNESYSPFGMGFLPEENRPSAPPPSVYTTPIAPRNLAEEFKTPPSKSKMSDSASELIEETKMKLRKERAEDARAKAIARKEKEQ
jgi:hypothetical protein